MNIISTTPFWKGYCACSTEFSCLGMRRWQEMSTFLTKYRYISLLFLVFGCKPLWKSSYFNSNFSSYFCVHNCFLQFPTISNFLNFHCIKILYYKLTIYKYYFEAYFFYFVWHYVRLKWKESWTPWSTFASLVVYECTQKKSSLAAFKTFTFKASHLIVLTNCLSHNAQSQLPRIPLEALHGLRSF